MLEKFFPNWAKQRERAKAEFMRYRALVKMAESLPDWVDEPDEDEWKILDSNKTGYDEQDLKKLREQSRKMYYMGGGRSIIDALVLFILGRNAAVECEDENSQEYWEAWCEANNWDAVSEEFIRRTFRDGEEFLRFFPPTMRKGFTVDNPTEHTVGTCRFVDSDEIVDETNRFSYGIETDPEDVQNVIRYHRTFWKGTQKFSEAIPAAEIVHMKILCDSNEKRGVPYLVGVSKYIKGYDLWLEDRRFLNRLRTIFNLIIKPDGVSPASFKSNFEDEDYTPAGKTPSKKLPKRGSVIVSQGVDYEFKRPDVQARDTATDGRNIERMICKITHLMEGVVTGDYSNQNYASSLIAESPMVKMIERWQDKFDLAFQQVFKTVIRIGKRAGHLQQGASEKSKANFDSVVHHNLEEDTNAYQIHKTNGWASNRTIATKLGYDYDAEREQIEREDDDERERAAAGEFGDGYPVVARPNSQGQES